MQIGDNVRNSAGMTLICEDKVVLGNNVLIGWNTLIMDTDYHRVVDAVNQTSFPDKRAIHIGERVWIGLGSSILKGVSIAPGCIIAASSVVTKDIIDENCMAAGNPAIIKKHNVTREL